MSNKFPGGLIRKTPVTPAGPFQFGAAPGIWTLAEASYWVKQGLWPTQGNTLAVEDVFSTYLYTGTGAAQTITNGINLSGKGGLVWSKARSSATGHNLFDTARGRGSTLYTNLSNGQFGPSSATQDLTSFNNNGFSLGTTSNSNVNDNTVTYASWTFRKAPNFFDVVTYTGNGANRTIAHNLGVAPGMILVKRTDTTGDWQVYHRSNANTQYMVLNDTAAVATGATRWNSTTPTSTEFSVGTDATVNASGGTYVAYLFAHNTASDGLIQCGSFTTDGSGNAPQVTLGWEPQWVMFKRANSSTFGGWQIVDTMRGWVNNGSAADDYTLFANLSNSEGSAADRGFPTATGFNVGYTGAVSSEYIYMAIRRGPMKTPTLGTSVYSAIATTGTGTNSRQITGYGFNPDFLIFGPRSQSGYNRRTWDRLRNAILYTDNTSSEAAVGLYAISSAALQNGYIQGTDDANAYNQTGTTWVNYGFGRAPGFMDVVCYTGNGASNRQLNHNLGVAPELMIGKSRSGTFDWCVYHKDVGNTKATYLNGTGTPVTSSDFWQDTNPTSTVFTIGSINRLNTNGNTQVMYLFASVPGVSKVGTYTGNGSSQTINCAFTTGARFVLIKRTDSTGDWYVWDSTRGIVAGNDPYLALNTTAVEVTSDDSVDTDNTGFIVNQVSASNVNVSAATYIFLAIA